MGRQLLPMGMPHCPGGRGAERSARSLARVSRCILFSRRRRRRIPDFARGDHVATSRILLISDSGDSVVLDALRGAGHEPVVVADVDAALATEATAGAVEVVVL